MIDEAALGKDAPCPACLLLSARLQPAPMRQKGLHVGGFGDLNFFGRDPGYFFAWHVDTDFHFDTPRKPDAHVQWIQNPNLWFSENADDANDSVSHHWDIEKLN